MGFLIRLGDNQDSLERYGFCGVFVVVLMFEREQVLLGEDKPSPWLQTGYLRQDFNILDCF